MTLRNLYYNYTGYPYSYEEQLMRQNAPLNANVAGFGTWLRYPFNKNKRINAGFQEDTGSFNAPITNYNTTGNGTTDWNSGFVTGQMQQEQFTRPQSNQLNLTMDYQSNTKDNPIVEMNSGNVKESNDNTQGFNIGGGWANAIGPSATNIANAFLDTEASTADRVAGALGISALAKQWTADTSKGDAKLKEMQNNLISSAKPNYIQDASSTWGANNAVKLNNKSIISPISSVSGLPSLKDFKGNWWRNMGASVAQGAASGSVGGPWGALGGAVTGLLGSIGGLFGRTGRAQKAYDDFLAKRRTLMSAQQSAFDKAVKDQTLSNMQALANGNTQQRINDMANIRAYGGNLFDGGGTIKEGDEETTQEPVYEGGELPEITVSAEPMPWYEKAWRKGSRFVNNNIISPTLGRAKYAWNYLNSKLADGDDSSYFLDLSNKDVKRVQENNQSDVDTILANDFVEEDNPNSLRRKADFINTSDTLIGDMNIPLRHISTYYGVEDGKLKAGTLDSFKDNTLIVPNRASNIGKIKEWHPSSLIDETYKHNPIARWGAEKLGDLLSSSFVDDYVTNKVMESLSDDDINSLKELLLENDGIENPTQEDLKTAAILYTDLIDSNPLQQKISDYRTRLYDYADEKNPARVIRGFAVNENNDTIPDYKFNTYPKGVFADENGNAVFFSGLTEENDKLINEYLKKHPSYPVMLDNGRFSHYTTNNDLNVYSGGMIDPNETMVIGVNNNTKAMGGNLYTDLSPNMISLWNNKQQIDQQKVNMQQMNFGLGNSFNQKLNTFDYGGSMNGMDLPTGMQSYENGGTHEQNPYGGIQVGVDQQGNPNLVEEGEFRWGDYIFSDRINVDPTLLSRYNLAPATKHQGKKANKGKLSYADMAKKYAKKNGELANDPIGKNTLEAYMKRLQDAQEDQKFQDSMEQQKQDAINQYRNALSTPQQGNPMYGAMKYNGMGNAATQQGVNAGMSDLGQQGGGNEVLSNTNRSGNNMLHAFGGNLFWDGGMPQIKPKLLNVNPNLVLGNNYMDSWTANNAGTPRLFSSTTPMYTGENPEANFTAYQKRYPTLPSDAKGMQQLLVNEGFDIGNTGPNKDGVDGIWGNKSQAAWYDFLRAYNHRPNTMNQYDLIGSNNQPSTSNNQASYNGGLNLGVRDGDATTDANNSGNGQTSYGNAEGNTNIDGSNLTGNINTGNTTTGTYATNAFKEDREGIPLYNTSGKFATFGKGLTPMLYDWMNKTNTKYDPNQRPANELVDMGNNSTFLRTADTIGGYRAPNLMDAERMNNAAQAQGIAALQAALNVGNGNRAFAANQIQQQGYNTGMSIGNNYATVQQANNDERFKNDSFNTALDQANANIRNSMYQDNQKGQQIGQQMKIDAKKYANDYLQKENWYADRTNRNAMDNRATNQAAWTDNALNYFITQAQENAERNRQNNDITKRYWSDKDGVMHYIGDSGLNGKIREYFRSHGIDNGTFRDDRLAAFNSIIQNNKAKDVADENGELWSTVQGLMDDEIAARNKETADAKKKEADELQEYRDQFDSELAQLQRYGSDKMYGNYWRNQADLDYYSGATGKFNRDEQSLSQLRNAITRLKGYNERYNKWTPQNVTAYGGRINNGNKSNKNGYYTYTY